MKKCSKCGVKKPLAEFHRDKAGADGHRPECKPCKKVYDSKWHKLDRKNNPEKVLKRKRDEKKKNRKRYNASSALRKAQKRRATVPWADLEKIKQIYILCPEGFQVDHIVPLKGEIVSGLHVEYNLQYLTPAENLKKGNKWPYPERTN